MNYKHILVAVDLSEEVHQVMDRAIALAQTCSASLSLIHVVEPLIIESGYEISPVLSPDVEMSLLKRAEAFLGKLSEQYGLKAEGNFVTVGAVKQEILRHIEQNDIDLLVIGTHGRHGVSVLLGSTANAVLHGTPCDVLAVRVGKN